MTATGCLEMLFWVMQKIGQTYCNMNSSGTCLKTIGKNTLRRLYTLYYFSKRSKQNHRERPLQKISRLCRGSMSQIQQLYWDLSDGSIGANSGDLVAEKTTAHRTWCGTVGYIASVWCEIYWGSEELRDTKPGHLWKRRLLFEHGRNKNQMDLPLHGICTLELGQSSQYILRTLTLDVMARKSLGAPWKVCPSCRRILVIMSCPRNSLPVSPSPYGPADLPAAQRR